MSKKLIKITGSVKDGKGFLTGNVEMESSAADRLIDLGVAEEIENPKDPEAEKKIAAAKAQASENDLAPKTPPEPEKGKTEKAAAKKAAAKKKKASVKTGDQSSNK